MDFLPEIHRSISQLLCSSKKKKFFCVDKVDIDKALYLIHENSDVNQKGKAYFVGNKELVRIF